MIDHLFTLWIKNEHDAETLETRVWDGFYSKQPSVMEASR